MPDALLLWTVVTNTAAMGVTTLAAVAAGGLLYGAGARALAVRWGLLFVALLAVVLASKVAFFGWGIGIRSLDFAGFSGHAARAGAVMPLLGLLLGLRFGARWRALGLAGGVLLAALAAVSRVVLDAHSVSEAAAGGLLGLLFAAPVLWALRDWSGTVDARPVLVLCLLLLTPMPGAGAPHKQGWSTRFVMRVALALSGREQPFTRAQWRAATPP